MADTEFIEIPLDDITFGIDDDGLPKTVPVERAIEAAVEPPAKEVEPEPVEKPKAVKAPIEKPGISEADLDAERRAKAEAQAERETARKELEQEREARAKIETQLANTNDFAAKATWEKINADHDQIVSAIAFAQEQQQQDKAELKRAYELGDMDAFASANERMQTRAAQLVQLESGKRAAKSDIERVGRDLKDYYDQRDQAKIAKKAEPAPEPKAEPPKQTADQWIDQWPKDTTAKWLRENKEFVTDPGKHRKLLAFSNLYAAENGDNTLHTPEFVAALNAKFNPQAETDNAESDMADETEIEQPKPEAAPVKKSAPAAPVSRGVPGKSATQSSPNAIKLTQEQYAVAPELFPSASDLDPEVLKKFGGWSQTAARFQYHRNLERAQKDGRFDPR